MSDKWMIKDKNGRYISRKKLDELEREKKKFYAFRIQEEDDFIFELVANDYISLVDEYLDYGPCFNCRLMVGQEGRIPTMVLQQQVNCTGIYHFFKEFYDFLKSDRTAEDFYIGNDVFKIELFKEADELCCHFHVGIIPAEAGWYLKREYFPYLHYFVEFLKILVCESTFQSEIAKEAIAHGIFVEHRR